MRLLVDISGVYIECRDAGGPYRVRCGRCRWEKRTTTVGAAVRERHVHCLTLKHSRSEL